MITNTTYGIKEQNPSSAKSAVFAAAFSLGYFALVFTVILVVGLTPIEKEKRHAIKFAPERSRPVGDVRFV